MKGIAHFLTGVALATFFPEIVRAGAQGSLLPVLGGIGGILPDTLDFRFGRYFEKYDEEIDPGPQPDAHEIAERVAGAMQRAYESGKPQNVMLHTVRLGADEWRQYVIRFDPAHGEVAVRVGPVVNTAQAPLPAWAGGHGTPHCVEGLQDADGWVGGHDTSHCVEGLHASQPPPLSSPPSGGIEPLSSPLSGGIEGGEVRVKVGVPMAQTYDAENRIDIFSGPSFKFERRGDQLHVHFLDWHRRWSHSLTLAAALGLVTAGGAALAEFCTRGGLSRTPLWTGLVVGLGFAGHVLEDQLGFMGSNLLWPFTKRRTAGVQFLHSGDAAPNFLTVWTAAALILFNLDRFSTRPLLPPGWFLGLAVALPVAVLGGLYGWQRRRREPEAKEALRQRDIVAEVEEVEMG